MKKSELSGNGSQRSPIFLSSKWSFGQLSIVNKNFGEVCVNLTIVYKYTYIL